MSVWWCRGCGMEDTHMHDACKTCGSALQVAEIEWLNEDELGEETVFEIETEPHERAAIVQGLMTEGIRHRWEGVTDLVAADINVDAVDKILDEVLGEDTEVDGNTEEEDDYEGGGEDDYVIISTLYDVADRLRKRRDDDDIAAYLDATGATLAAPTPFGMDDETWADIQSAARNTAAALQEDPKAPIEADLKALRNQLHELV